MLKKFFLVSFITLNVLILPPSLYAFSLNQTFINDPKDISATAILIVFLQPFIQIGIILLGIDFIPLTIYLMRNLRWRNLLKLKVILALSAWVAIIAIYAFYLSKGYN